MESTKSNRSTASNHSSCHAEQRWTHYSNPTEAIIPRDHPTQMNVTIPEDNAEASMPQNDLLSLHNT